MSVAVIAFIVVGACVLMVLWHAQVNASAADIIAEYIEPEPVEFTSCSAIPLAPVGRVRRTAPQLGWHFLVFSVGL